MAFRQRHYKIINTNPQLSIPPAQCQIIQQPSGIAPSSTAQFRQPKPYYRKISLSQSKPFTTPPEVLDQSSPQYVLQRFTRKLTQYEQEEILTYHKIYYFGQNAQKTYNLQRANFGYDDSEGDARPVIRDHVGYRYELTQLLGQGSFGKVFRAFDHLEKRIVALKMLKNRKRFRKQGLVELKILQALTQADPSDTSHCVHIIDQGDFRNHLYFCTEMLQSDLYALLCKGNLQGFSLSRIRKYAFQSLLALEFAAKNRVIHADIKPENILVSTSDEI